MWSHRNSCPYVTKRFVPHNCTKQILFRSCNSSLCSVEGLPPLTNSVWFSHNISDHVQNRCSQISAVATGQAEITRIAGLEFATIHKPLFVPLHRFHALELRLKPLILTGFTPHFGSLKSYAFMTLPIIMNFTRILRIWITCMISSSPSTCAHFIRLSLWDADNIRLSGSTSLSLVSPKFER